MSGDHPASPVVYVEVLLIDLPDRMLLIRHVGDGEWSAPGSWVRPNESPRDAARRAVRDQLRIDVPIGRPLVVEWRDEPDELHFVFDGGIPEPVAYNEVEPDWRLVSEWRYVFSAETAPLLAKPAFVRYTAALAAQSTSAAVAYLENGRAPRIGNAGEGSTES
jgi:8-oxo-dGTP diphosphatase